MPLRSNISAISWRPVLVVEEAGNKIIHTINFGPEGSIRSMGPSSGTVCNSFFSLG
jgi:hypothetical protein